MTQIALVVEQRSWLEAELCLILGVVDELIFKITLKVYVANNTQPFLVKMPPALSQAFLALFGVGEQKAFRVSLRVCATDAEAACVFRLAWM